MIFAVTNAIYATAYVEAWKIQDFNGFEPVTSRHRCDALTEVMGSNPVEVQPRSQGFFPKKMGRAGKGPGIGRSVLFFFWLAGCNVQINVIFMQKLWNWISYSNWRPVTRRRQLRFFPRIPVCMLPLESKDNHANLLHALFLGVFWGMWPADAKAFSHPSHFLRENALGARLVTWTHFNYILTQSICLIFY